MNTWLAEIREKNNLTQKTIADKAGIARTTYSSIEQGRRNPSVKNAMRIAEVLGFDWTIFFKK
ncbi:helix-turn-helix transcriptional regulator [Carnobacterium maltaromaticum]|uniref:helix-turn-helix transcriptional regulator n=1 Tax=Carnobacterium maltaromaticum TaxID=2751 RepID=UPI00165ACB8A|nr:helix-turn-helix transcriptional regulator [Carnobacterium maltaromaticum]MBC9808150.1 helix-turn-helix domain-containing protein [Carnobacterium maltaromaticum]